MMARLRGYWRQHFLGCELCLAVVVGLGFVAWAEYFGGGQTLDVLFGQRRSEIYGALASIAGSLLGFVLATVSIVLGFSTSPKLKLVRESAHYDTLWKVFTSAIKWLGISTCALLVGLIFDRDSAPLSWILYSCAFLSLVAVLRVIRTIWVLERVIAVVTSGDRK